MDFLRFLVWISCLTKVVTFQTEFILVAENLLDKKKNNIGIGKKTELKIKLLPHDLYRGYLCPLEAF